MYPRSKEHRKKQIVQAAPLGAAVAHQKISKRDAGSHVAGYSNAMLLEWAALPVRPRNPRNVLVPPSGRAASAPAASLHWHPPSRCVARVDAYRQPHPIAHTHWRCSQPQVGPLQLHPHPQRSADAGGHCCHHRARPKHMCPVHRCSGCPAPACGCGQVQPTGGGVSIIGQSPESLLGLVGERQAPDPPKQLEDG